jgi:metal-responsive CopG/Arc/MetJ family transcriptional regulator
MKAIQFTIDEQLLAELDACDEAQADGRSAVLRRALAEYLRRMRRAAIAEQYARAYARKAGLGKEFEGWEDQGQWPEE